MFSTFYLLCSFLLLAPIALSTCPVENVHKKSTLVHPVQAPGANGWETTRNYKACIKNCCSNTACAGIIINRETPGQFSCFYFSCDNPGDCKPTHKLNYVVFRLTHPTTPSLNVTTTESQQTDQILSTKRAGLTTKVGVVTTTPPNQSTNDHVTPTTDLDSGTESIRPLSTNEQKETTVASTTAREGQTGASTPLAPTMTPRQMDPTGKSKHPVSVTTRIPAQDAGPQLQTNCDPKMYIPKVIVGDAIIIQSEKMDSSGWVAVEKYQECSKLCCDHPDCEGYMLKPSKRGGRKFACQLYRCRLIGECSIEKTTEKRAVIVLRLVETTVPPSSTIASTTELTDPTTTEPSTMRPTTVTVTAAETTETATQKPSTLEQTTEVTMTETTLDTTLQDKTTILTTPLLTTGPATTSEVSSPTTNGFTTEESSTSDLSSQSLPLTTKEGFTTGTRSEMLSTAPTSSATTVIPTSSEQPAGETGTTNDQRRISPRATDGMTPSMTMETTRGSRITSALPVMADVPPNLAQMPPHSTSSGKQIQNTWLILFTVILCILLQR